MAATLEAGDLLPPEDDILPQLFEEGTRSRSTARWRRDGEALLRAGRGKSRNRKRQLFLRCVQCDSAVYARHGLTVGRGRDMKQGRTLCPPCWWVLTE